jgi:hypothetical protein
MHGANQTHLHNVVNFIPHGAVIPGSYDVPAVVLFPLGRDPAWNTGPAEMDLLETTADGVARLNLDPDRLVLSGISAGGIGTFRHVARHPDMWTGGYSIVGSGTANLENLTNVPFRAHNGLADPLVNAAAWRSSADALLAAGTVDYRTVLVHTSSHVPVRMGNCWYLDLLSRPRQVNPARVRFTVDPKWFIVDAKAGIDLRPDRAYWVSELESRNDQAATIDAVSLARADRAPATADIDAVEQNATESRDFCGARPGMQGVDNWHQLGRAMTAGKAQPVSNGMKVMLRGLAGATLDVARMGLSVTGDLGIAVDGDGPATLVLTGPWTGTMTILRDGAPVSTATPSGGRLTIAGDFTGTHQYTVR